MLTRVWIGYCYLKHPLLKSFQNHRPQLTRYSQIDSFRLSLCSSYQSATYCGTTGLGTNDHRGLPHDTKSFLPSDGVCTATCLSIVNLLCYVWVLNINLVHFTHTDVDILDAVIHSLLLCTFPLICPRLV